MGLRLVLIVLFLVPCTGARGQVLPESRFEILRIMIADTAAARLRLPLGSDGVDVSEHGQIDEGRLQRELLEEGSTIEAGQVVEITAIRFDDDKITVELDGGGDNGEGILSRVSVGVGNRTTPLAQRELRQASGSRIILLFDEKVPVVLTVDGLKEFLSPVLDFNKQNFMDSDVEAIPVEFQEAVRQREVEIGMDRSTVLLALDRPDERSWETDEDGIEQETWIYRLPGQRVDFVTFEEGIVVSIRHY